MSNERVRLREEMEQLRKANYDLTKKQLELVEEIDRLDETIKENCSRTRELAKELKQKWQNNEAQSNTAGPSTMCEV